MPEKIKDKFECKTNDFFSRKLYAQEASNDVIIHYLNLTKAIHFCTPPMHINCRKLRGNVEMGPKRQKN